MRTATTNILKLPPAYNWHHLPPGFRTEMLRAHVRQHFAEQFTANPGRNTFVLPGVPGEYVRPGYKLGNYRCIVVIGWRYRPDYITLLAFSMTDSAPGLAEDPGERVCEAVFSTLRDFGANPVFKDRMDLDDDGGEQLPDAPCMSIEEMNALLTA